jgi:hypothetical protein
MAKIIKESIGKDVEFKDISRNEAEQILQKQKTIDQYEAKYLLEFYDLVKSGKMAATSTDFETLTNDKPTTLDVFCTKYRAEMVGQAPVEE